MAYKRGDSEDFDEKVLEFPWNYPLCSFFSIADWKFNSFSFILESSQGHSMITSDYDAYLVLAMVLPLEREPLNRWETEEEIPIFHLKLIFVPPEKTKDNELLRDRISFQFISSQVNRHNPQFEHKCLGWTKQSPLNSPNWCRWRRSFEEVDVHIRLLSRMRCVSWLFLAKNHLLFQIERRTRINDDDWLSKWRSRFVFFNDQWELIHSTISMITRSPNKQILDLIVCDSFPKVC